MNRKNLLRCLPVLVLSCCLAMPAAGGLADTIEQVKPSVVLVGSHRPADSPRFRFRGTGFVVAPGNLVVSNLHVLPGASEEAEGGQLAVQVRTGSSSFQMRSAKVLAMDFQHDLTLIEIEGAPVPALALGDSAAVREGQSLAFMGFPIGSVLGYSSVTHRATVSSITPARLPMPSSQQLNASAIRSVREGNFDIFQLDATAYPGNSGGPLFDPDSGKVVGVLNMVMVKGTRESAISQPTGISYAIPGRHVLELLRREAQ